MADRLDANGYVIADKPEPEPDAPHLAPDAIAACRLCDADGYRGATVCRHIDHYAASAQGRAAVNAELQKIRNRRKGATA